MGAATLVLTESLRDLIERQRGTSVSRTAAAIRHRSAKGNFRESDRRSRDKRASDDFGSIPLFERE